MGQGFADDVAPQFGTFIVAVVALEQIAPPVRLNLPVPLVVTEREIAWLARVKPALSALLAAAMLACHLIPVVVTYCRRRSGSDMYLPEHFEETRTEVLHSLIRSHPLGTLVTLDAGGSLQANPIPFLVESGPHAHGTLRGHVARANPLWRETRGDVDALVVFQGAQSYISPGWYPSKVEHGKVVPTWNYVVVQGRGRLRAIDDASWVRALVARLTDRSESTRSKPWSVDDAPAEYLETMLRMIVGIEIELSALVGKWKVSQNRSAADRQGVAAGLAALALQAGDAQADAMAAEVARRSAR